MKIIILYFALAFSHRPSAHYDFFLDITGSQPITIEPKCEIGWVLDFQLPSGEVRRCHMPWARYIEREPGACKPWDRPCEDKDIYLLEKWFMNNSRQWNRTGAMRKI